MENSLLMQATFSCSVVGTAGSRNWQTGVQLVFFPSCPKKKKAVFFSSVSQMVWPGENAEVSILVSPRTTQIKNMLPSAAITLLLRNKSMKFNCDFSRAFYLWLDMQKWLRYGTSTLCKLSGFHHTVYTEPYSLRAG